MSLRAKQLLIVKVKCTSMGLHNYVVDQLVEEVGKSLSGSVCIECFRVSIGIGRCSDLVGRHF